MRHVGGLGKEVTAGVSGLNDTLQKMTETRLGQKRLKAIERTVAKPLGVKGLEEMHSAVSTEASVYDILNHLTYVSQRKSLNPRRELELAAGNLLKT